MGKVLQNKLRKQQALLDSAYELFTTIGFTRTTIRDIALKADVAKGTFYLYFNDKVEIRDALIRAKASQLLQKAFASMEDRVSNGSDEMDTAGKFIYIIDYIIDYISGDINFVKFMSKHLSWGLFTGEQHKVQYHDENMAPVTDFQEYIHLMLEAGWCEDTRTAASNFHSDGTGKLHLLRPYPLHRAGKYRGIQAVSLPQHQAAGQ